MEAQTTPQAFVAELIRQVPEMLHLDPGGKLLLWPNHGHRGVSLRILQRMLGALPDQQTVAQTSFYAKLDLMIREMPPKVAQRNGLINLMPPDDIHFIARKRGVFFDFLNADAVMGNLQAAGFDFADGRRVLDFGCSSGATLRCFSLALPDMAWHGVDPRTDSIAWAQSAMPDVTFSTSPRIPPLACATDHFDAVYAASVWSHFSAPAARSWLDEMARILPAGGYLCLTTQGYYSLAKKVLRDAFDPALAQEILADLQADGHAFRNNDITGRQKQDRDMWGTSFFTRSWLEQQTRADWKLVRHTIGEWGGRQDISVLQRRET